MGKTMSKKDTTPKQKYDTRSFDDTMKKLMYQSIETPSLSDITPPPGYRAVSFSHALLEYAKPVLEFVEDSSVDEVNQAYQIAMLLWNYTIDHDREKNSKDYEDLSMIVANELNINHQEALKFMDTMLERKHSLLPPEIQPDIPRVMFIKKEEKFCITPFDYTTLIISDSVIPPDKEDIILRDMLHRMDKNIRYNTDYDKWEKSYFRLEDTCKKRFKTWLKQKDLSHYQENFLFYAEIFLNFTYRYVHNDRVTLSTITPIYFKEFFEDHVLRKVMLEPSEYVEIPPAIKTFYIFLSEKGYIENPRVYIEAIDAFEPLFVEILQKRF